MFQAEAKSHRPAPYASSRLLASQAATATATLPASAHGHQIGPPPDGSSLSAGGCELRRRTGVGSGAFDGWEGDAPSLGDVPTSVRPPADRSLDRLLEGRPADAATAPSLSAGAAGRKETSSM